jgi:hypothetical protein
MRKVFVASVGMLLVLFLATSGYSAQGTAAVQASGDITLNFGIQHEIDFEVRDNYDLDDGLTDGCGRAAPGGRDCSGAPSSTSAVVGDLSDGFIVQETRLIVQGSQGDIWKARVVLEGEDNWELEQLPVGIERAWADIKLYDTPVHVKVGLLWDELDPFRLVWSDDEMAIKVYATHGNISWAVWYIKENDVKDDTSADARHATQSGRDGDQDYYLARVTLDFGPFQLSPAVGVVRNRLTTTDPRFATGAASLDPGLNYRRPGNNWSNVSGVTVDETVWYPGLIAKGNFGPVSFVGEAFLALGEIGDDGAIDAQREQDVVAVMAAADIGVKLGAWTPHAGIVFVSGDDNPHDNDAEAWAPIASDNENLLGMRGIMMDDNVSKLGIHDDSLTAETVNPAARMYFQQPGMIALFGGLKGRPTKKIKTDLWLVYFTWNKEKQWEYVNGIVTTTSCFTKYGVYQQDLCTNSNFTDAIADGSGLVSTVDDEVGWELNGAVTYDYNKHVSLRIAAAVFWPGDGTEVVAQCANAAGGGFLLGGAANNGCASPITGNNGIALVTLDGLERANDEAFNSEVELMVQF